MESFIIAFLTKVISVAIRADFVMNQKSNQESRVSRNEIENTKRSAVPQREKPLLLKGYSLWLV